MNNPFFDFLSLQIAGPADRAFAIRNNLAIIAALPDAQVNIGALQAAFEALSKPRETDSILVAPRRNACADIAAAIRAASPHNGGPYALPGDEKAAFPWFMAQIDAWENSADPREVTWAATATRELQELSGAILCCETGLNHLIQQGGDVDDLVARGITTPGMVRRFYPEWPARAQ